ncbi:hypothetical protein EON65_33845 [archaeon]|nr:MAG: hypothetical protein EON65_33845 [archaeon]
MVRECGEGQGHATFRSFYLPGSKTVSSSEVKQHRRFVDRIYSHYVTVVTKQQYLMDSYLRRIVMQHSDFADKYSSGGDQSSMLTKSVYLCYVVKPKFIFANTVHGKERVLGGQLECSLTL